MTTSHLRERKFCDKLDRDVDQWNKAFPDKPPRIMKCGYPLPCPWHTVVIETGAPRVHIPQALNTTQSQRVKIRKLAVELNDALEKDEQ